MATAKAEFVFEDVAELLKRLGNIPAGRVCMNPLPGTATERDLLRMHGRPRKLYELVDGTLVEKAMGHKESVLASELGRLLANFVIDHDLGYCTAADDLIRVTSKRVRGPDVTFVSWKTRPERTRRDDRSSRRRRARRQRRAPGVPAPARSAVRTLPGPDRTQEAGE